MIIYILKDPIDFNIRYVGITTRSIKARLRQHIADARRNNSTHKDHWINKLIKISMRPLIEVIDYADSIDELYKKEITYIKHYRDCGYNLTNATDGGEGCIGRTPWNKGMKCPESLRDAVRKANTGRDALNKKDTFIKNINNGNKLFFNSLTDAANFIGSSVGNVSRSSKTGRPCMGYLINNETENPKKKGSMKTRPVIAVNAKDGTILKFKSITDAANYAGVNKTNIHAVCNNKKKSAAGYIWKYSTTGDL